jgi:hypothetical protein
MLNQSYPKKHSKGIELSRKWINQMNQFNQVNFSFKIGLNKIKNCNNN